MTPDEALQLIAQGEGQRIEFKQSLAEEKKAIESLCAFANADGGIVFFGISPRGKVSATPVGENTLEKFSNYVRANTDPSLSPTIERLPVGHGEIVAVTVPKHARGQLFYAFRWPFIRVGPTNQVMRSDECRARLIEGQEDRSQEVDRLRFAVARPLAGPESEQVDALALGRTIARTGDKITLRTVVRITRQFFLETWPARIQALNRDAVERQVKRDEVYEVCLPYVQNFAGDIQLVEAFGLGLVEAEYAQGLIDALRIVEDWISISGEMRAEAPLRPVRGAPSLLALRVLATWGAKAAEDMSLNLLASLIAHPLETSRATRQVATLSLVDRRDMFWPDALLGHADLGVRYLTEQPWNNTAVQKMFARQQDYLNGLSRFLFLAALLHEAKHSDEVPLYPGFKLIEGSAGALQSFVSRLSASPDLLECLATMASEDVLTFRANWPERVRRLNDASLGSAEPWFFHWDRVPEQV